MQSDRPARRGQNPSMHVMAGAVVFGAVSAAHGVLTGRACLAKKLGESSNAAGAQQACQTKGGVFTSGSCDRVGECFFGNLVGCCTSGNTAAAPYTCSYQEVTSNVPASVSAMAQADCAAVGGTFAATYCNVAARCLFESTCVNTPCLSDSDCGTGDSCFTETSTCSPYSCCY